MKQLKQPTVGDRVQFATRWLRSTGQFTGDPAPCSWGPFARARWSSWASVIWRRYGLTTVTSSRSYLAIWRQ